MRSCRIACSSPRSPRTREPESVLATVALTATTGATIKLTSRNPSAASVVISAGVSFASFTIKTSCVHTAATPAELPR